MATFRSKTGATVAMHVLHFSTDEGFIHFDAAGLFATKLGAELTGLQSETQTVQHEPWGLLRDAQSTGKLIGTDAIFAAHQHPERRKPLLQRDRGILEDGFDFDGELATATPTFPALLGLYVVGIFGIIPQAIRAMRAIGPAHHGYGVDADLFVAKVLNGLLQGLRSFGDAFHARTIPNRRGLVKLIIAAVSV